MSNVFEHPLMDSLAYANGQPDCEGIYKSCPEDFVVEEQIAYALSGQGEHLWCWVEKKSENTDWVSHQLAKWAGVTTSRIGVAGQKDRHAVTRQWFSIQLPGKEDPNPDDLALETVTILKMVRHQRKLQTGGLTGNRFELIIRNIKGTHCDLEHRLETIKAQGVPNFFGEQRFGHQAANLPNATAFFNGTLTRVKRAQKTMYLSATRSWMFNLILSERIKQASWNHFIKGDVLQLEGSSKWFQEDGSSDLAQRVEQADLHPTGALFGRGSLPTKQMALAIEQAVIDPFDVWQRGLETWGLKQDRRSLRVIPQGMTWQWLEKETTLPPFSGQAHLKLSFSLPSGSYATAVLRELLAVKVG